MPKYWYDRASCRTADLPDEETRELNLAILADKKPYFMRYIYPSLNKQYTTYISNTKKKCLREFRITIEELMEKDEAELTEEERTFLRYYQIKMPVGTNNCVMNRICRRFEREFDGYVGKYKNGPFDFSRMKSGAQYSAAQFKALESVYRDYTKRLSEYSQYAKLERIDQGDQTDARVIFMDEFRRQCYEVCSDSKALCDILLDICYRREGTKQLVWDVCGEEIIDNLLRNSGEKMWCPHQDSGGDVEFCGERYRFDQIVFREEDPSVYCTQREGICGECDPDMQPWPEAD